MGYDRVIYKWYKKGKLIRIAESEWSRTNLLKIREEHVRLKMKIAGKSREEALKSFGTIVKVDFSRGEETTI